MRGLLFVGYQGASSKEEPLAYSTRSGKFLATLLGIDEDEYSRIPRRNFLEVNDPSPPTVELFKARRRQVIEFIERSDPAVVVALGTRAGSWLAGDEKGEERPSYLDPVPLGSRTLYVIPHPSGRCRTWNDPVLRDQVQAFVRELWRKHS